MVTYNGTVYYYVTNLQGDVVVTHRTVPCAQCAQCHGIAQ